MKAAFFIVLALDATAAAQATTAPTSSRSLDELITQLGAPREDARRSSANAIIEIGKSAYGPLRDAFAQTRQFEVKRRIQKIVEQIYLLDHLGPPSAFLGIQLQPIAPQTAKGQPDPDILFILVGDVIPGTAAEAAGIHRDDVIMRMNGEPIRRISDNVASLQDWIRKQKPGTRCSLQIRRGAVIMDLEVTLRGRPIGSVQDPAELERVRQAMQSFAEWWRTEFDPQRTVDVSTPSFEDPNWRLKAAGAPR